MWLPHMSIFVPEAVLVLNEKTERELSNSLSVEIITDFGKYFYLN